MDGELITCRYFLELRPVMRVMVPPPRLQVALLIQQKDQEFKVPEGVASSMQSFRDAVNSSYQELNYGSRMADSFSTSVHR